MRLTSRWSPIVVILLWVALPARAQTDARKLGVYFDAEGTVCTGTILPGTPTEIYIIGKVSAAEGMTGASFRFIGAPQSWDLYPVANPLILAIGDPFANGAVLSFPSCQSTANVLLYTVLVMADEVIPDLYFLLGTRVPLINPNFICPTVVHCDAPVYTQTCAESAMCIVNPTRTPRCALVAVDEQSWSAVKSIFR